ncbi:MAG: transporter [Limnobacter sp.]|nr:transporter [Limnobacter sp.]
MNAKKTLNLSLKLGFVSICTLIAIPAFAEGAKTTFTTGFDYSTGKYGQAEDTKITYIPVIGKYEKDRLTLKLTVPYIKIEGPGGVTPDSRVVGAIPTGNTRVSESGLGDVVFGATYNALELHSQKTYIDVGAKIKLPTASESRGLGTGKVDYSVLADAYKTIGRNTLIGTVGYKVFGDPDGVNLNNVFFVSLGTSYKLDDKNSLGVSVDLRERTTDTSTGLREYSVFHSHKFDNTYKLQSYLVFGDTRSSVDVGGGMMLGINW